MRSVLRRRLGFLAILVLAVRVIFPEATHHCVMRTSVAVSAVATVSSGASDVSASHAGHGAAHQHASTTLAVTSDPVSSEESQHSDSPDHAPCDCGATCCCATPQWHSAPAVEVTMATVQPVESSQPRDHRVVAPYRHAHALPFSTAPPEILLS